MQFHLLKLNTSGQQISILQLMFKPNQIAKTNKIYIRKYAKLIVKEEDCPLRIMGVGGCAPNQMTQGTRRPNQMEFKGRPNIAGECLDIFQYKI